ncbi:hypothetical protein CPB83DRAFT_850478 [Crepidotus variabilis]|uniref:Zn(2)-C6 fungal-type domain-containing protein n=1 Tax=Crepidotus variabilis TaxID=179855 RepID=A0A9P6EIY4_9AGAR|nr:hypothetical protein CPB83DRAFT_850478 [Crepidotus variabilis]
MAENNPHDLTLKAESSMATKFRPTTKATRRIRGEIACAECRRLKVRCDRVIPCSTCVKRGCGALCPNEIIPPGDGGRFVLAATNHLLQKITKLESRMRSLEDALAIMHGSESEHPHPLLAFPSDVDDDEREGATPQKAPEARTKTSEDFTEAFGTLCLDSQGGQRFFGPSGGSESLLQSAEPRAITHKLEDLDPSYFSPEINRCYQAFPFTPPNIIPSAVLPVIRSFLPSMERAISLCDTFLEHLSWMFHIVSRHKLMDLTQVIYQRTSGNYGPHDLALLLIVLGIGSLVDLNLPPYNLEAQHYYRLARASIVLQPVLGAQSIITIKALHLMSIYNGMSGKESNLEHCYALLDMAGQVALRIGFYIDPSRWGFEGREAYDRRVYFWNLMSAVLWQSLLTGRPPSLLLSFINCYIPTVDDENLFQEGEVPLGFGIWGFKASRECLIPVVRAILASKPPTYDVVMELDGKIRNLVVPTQDMLATQEDRTAISMRTFVRSHYQELMLMFLHRAHFAQAMLENPENPLKGPHSQSVHAAYSSACVVLRDTREQFSKNPSLTSRIWMVWSFAFTATVVVGTVAVRGAHLNLKPPPLEEFESTFNVFTKAAETSNRAARAVPILKAMLLKARQADRYYQGGGGLAPSRASGLDELQYLGAKTNVVQEGENTDATSAWPTRIPGNDNHWQSSFTSSHRGSHLEQPTSTLTPFESHSLPGSSSRTQLEMRGGWSGLLHDVPGYHQYVQPNTMAQGPSIAGRSSSTHRVSYDVPQSSMWNSKDFFEQGRSRPLDRPTEPPRGMMLDDRWASFMSHGIMEDAALFPQPKRG